MITANDIKTRGVKAIEEHLKHADRVGITVRGKVKYVVISVEEYDEIREKELDLALLEVEQDLKDGNFTSNLNEYFEELDKELGK